MREKFQKVAKSILSLFSHEVKGAEYEKVNIEQYDK
jgi:hypothetical protein